LVGGVKERERGDAKTCFSAGRANNNKSNNY